MDSRLLAERGIVVTKPLRARLDGFRLVLGARATLVPAAAATVYGMLMQVKAGDLARLYSAPGVERYRRAQVRVVTEDGAASMTVCYVLPQPLPATEPDREYAAKLHAIGVRLGMPARYLASIARVAGIESLDVLR